MAWLVEHAALLVDLRYVGKARGAAWSRTRGRNFNQRIICYDAKVLYKLCLKGPISASARDMGARWVEATFLVITGRETYTSFTTLWAAPM